jgi:cullin-associated NEDD8-dissociated protein 1
LVTKIPGTILAPLLDKLSTLTVENSVDNSIPALALRTVITTLPHPVAGVPPTKEVADAYTAVSRVLIPRLVGRNVVSRTTHVDLPEPPVGMLHADTQNEVDAEAVDVLIEVVRCFGPMLQPPEVDALQEVVVAMLENERSGSVVKKRAVVAVSILAVYTSDPLLSSFTSHLIESFRSPHLTSIKRRMYITILGSMARSIPSRFGPYLKTLAPFVLSALSQQELDDQMASAAEDGEHDTEADDVREAALVALEGFLASCGAEMRAYTEESIEAALRYLKYDPNYADDEDDEDMEGTSEDDDMNEFEDDDDFEADGGFDDDDDDGSWKVRRCAAKVLHTLISTRGGGDLLEDGTLYKQVAPVLVNRFSEREENVRLETIAAVAVLVRKTGESSMLTPIEPPSDYITLPNRKRRRESSSQANVDVAHSISFSAGLTSPVIRPLPASGPRADLAELSPAIIKAVTKLLKSKSVPSKQAAIILLSEMVAAQHGGLSEYFSEIVDPIVDSIKSSSSSIGSVSGGTTGGPASATASTLRIAALRLISDMCETHSSSVLQPYLGQIVPSVIAAATDKFYKISSEAINTVEQLIKALTPPRSRSAYSKHQADIQKLYEVVIGRVSANDADAEVRSRAIHALGILLSRTASGDGSKLLPPDSRAAALAALLERVKNETTRLAAVRVVDLVAASSSNKEEFKPEWIREVSLELAAQLRKSNRSLRGASLGALKSLLLSPSARNSLDVETINGLVSALLPLLSPADLHLLGPALLVLSALVLDEPKLVVTPELNSNICSLLTTSLGGSVIDSLLALVKNIGEKGLGQDLMKGLLGVGISGDPAVVGKVIGTLLVGGGSSVGVTIDSFLGELNKTKDDARKCLALAVLGEAGLRLGDKSPLQPETFSAFFEDSSDKVNLAAAVALGRAGAGNIPVYLPVILTNLDKAGASQYFYLHAIKEILQLSGSTSTDIGPYSEQIWGKLLAASQDEDNKAVGAECIGRLAIIDPNQYMPQLQVSLKVYDLNIN